MTSDCEHKRCIALFERLSEYVDNELDEITCRDIETHVSECYACKVCMETLKRTIALCKNVKKEPVPENLSFRLKEAVKQFTADHPIFTKTDG